ncbi:FGGY family carbohydrate kinase [Flavobacterium sp. ZT3R25]
MITGIGISYQMHGLVMVDEKHNPLRNAIIWCYFLSLRKIKNRKIPFF